MRGYKHKVSVGEHGGKHPTSIGGQITGHPSLCYSFTGTDELRRYMVRPGLRRGYKRNVSVAGAGEMTGGGGSMSGGAGSPGSTRAASGAAIASSGPCQSARFGRLAGYHLPHLE